MRRRMVSIVVATLLLIAWGCSVAPASQAANNDQSQVVSASWVSVSPGLGVCARYTLRTNVTFRSTYLPAQTTYPTRPRSYMVSDVQLHQPILTVRTYAFDRKSWCTFTPKPVSSITFAQHWGGYGCSFNPSIQVSIPWSVGLAVWPDCGVRYQAARSSSFGSGNTFTQYNTYNGSLAARWPNSLAFGTGSKPANPCRSVFVDSVISVGQADDAFGIGETSAQPVCLNAVDV